MYLLERSAKRFLKAWRYYIWVILELVAGVAIVVCQDSVAIAVQKRLECYERQFVENAVSIDCTLASDRFWDTEELPISYEDYTALMQEFPEDTELYYIQYGRIWLGLNGISVLGVSDNEFEQLTGYPMQDTVWIGENIWRMLGGEPGESGGQDCYIQGDSLYLYGSSFPCRVMGKETAGQSIISFSAGAGNDILFEECILIPIDFVPRIQGPESLFYNVTLEIGGEAYLQKADWIAGYLAERSSLFHYTVVDRYRDYIQNSQDLSSTIYLLGWIGKFALLLVGVGIVGIMLIHLDERKKDFAVSMVAGGTRLRLAAETVVEIFALCLLGGILALGVAGVAAPMLSTSQYSVELPAHSVGLAAEIVLGMAVLVCGVIFACIKIKEPVIALKEAKY